MKPQKDLRSETAALVVNPATSRVGLVKLGVVILLIVPLTILISLFIYAGSNWWVLHGPIWWAVIFPSCLTACAMIVLRVMVPFMRWSAELRCSVYTVTPEYVAVEADMGIFGRYSRQIPIVYIRDVTTHSSPIQRLCKVGSITVAPANGDSITFEDLADAEATRKAIWRLVNQRASG